MVGREARSGLKRGCESLPPIVDCTDKASRRELSGATRHCRTRLSQSFHSFWRGMLLWAQMLPSCGKLKRKVLFSVEHCRWGTLQESGALPSKPSSVILCVLLGNLFSLSLPPFLHWSSDEKVGLELFAF